jgi:hypothetical protein
MWVADPGASPHDLNSWYSLVVAISKCLGHPSANEFILPIMGSCYDPPSGSIKINKGHNHSTTILLNMLIRYIYSIRHERSSSPPSLYLIISRTMSSNKMKL